MNWDDMFALCPYAYVRVSVCVNTNTSETLIYELYRYVSSLAVRDFLSCICICMWVCVCACPPWWHSCLPWAQASRCCLSLGDNMPVVFQSCAVTCGQQSTSRTVQGPLDEKPQTGACKIKRQTHIQRGIEVISRSCKTRTIYYSYYNWKIKKITEQEQQEKESKSTRARAEQPGLFFYLCDTLHFLSVSKLTTGYLWDNSHIATSGL